MLSRLISRGRNSIESPLISPDNFHISNFRMFKQSAFVCLLLHLTVLGSWGLVSGGWLLPYCVGKVEKKPGVQSEPS